MDLKTDRQTEEQKSLARAIGERIAASRRGVRIEQKELARRLGVKPSTLNRWETGYTPISVYDLKRVAQSLKIPASCFLGEQPAEEVGADDLHLQYSVRRLIPEHRRVLLTLLHELLQLQTGDGEADMRMVEMGTDAFPSGDCQRKALSK